jgi:hypothetical protein
MMNQELINELIAKATSTEDTYPAGCNGYPVPLSSFDKELFAKLIIEECLEQIDYEHRCGDEWDISRRVAQHSIKERFGIK